MEMKDLSIGVLVINNFFYIRKKKRYGRFCMAFGFYCYCWFTFSFCVVCFSLAERFVESEITKSYLT